MPSSSQHRDEQVSFRNVSILSKTSHAETFVQSPKPTSQLTKLGNLANDDSVPVDLMRFQGCYGSFRVETYKRGRMKEDVRMRAVFNP